MAEPKVKAVVTRTREFRAFAELSYAHWVILENAKTEREGWSYECLAANILAAFKMEAYVNHIGPLLFQNWEERRSWRSKLKRVLEHLGVTPDADERFRTLGDVFQVRNQVAHGQSKTLSEEVEETGEMEELRRRKPQESWEERSTLEFAKRAYEHTESIIRQLHARAGRDDAELRRSGHSYSIKLTE